MVLQLVSKVCPLTSFESAGCAPPETSTESDPALDHDRLPSPWLGVLIVTLSRMVVPFFSVE